MPVPVSNIPPDVLPVWQQVAAWISLIIVGVFAGLYKFFSTLAKPPAREEPARQVVLETASLSDMQPVRDIAASLEALEGKFDKLLTLIGNAIEARHNEAESARLRAELKAELLAELKPLPQRQRRAKPRP